MNVSELKDFINTKPIGSMLDIATSQYAGNTTSPGYRFDAHSSAQAVRSLIKQGLIKGENRWRYYEVEVISHN